MRIVFLKSTPAAEAVGQLAVVEDLQQHVEHVRVRLLDLVEQDDRVGFAAHLFGELSAFFVAHVARRRTDRRRHGELLHVLAHVDADQRIFGIEEVARRAPSPVRSCRRRWGPRKMNEPIGRFGILQAGAGAADGLRHLLHRLLLADHLALHLLLHPQQLAAFLLRDLVDRDAGHHGHHFGHVLLAHLVTVALALFFPLALGASPVPPAGALLVAQLGGFLEVLASSPPCSSPALISSILAFERPGCSSGTTMLVMCTRRPPRPARRWPCRAGSGR